MTTDSQPQFAIDPTAPMDQMFVQVDTDQAEGGNATSASTNVIDLANPAGLDTRFKIRANQQDVELTASELSALASKGGAFDKQTQEIGNLRKLEPDATAWRDFQEAMTANPGAALAAYANQYGMVVGSLSDDGAGQQAFNPVDLTNAPPTANATATQNPELADLKEAVQAQNRMMQALLAERQHDTVAQSMGATEAEMAQAQSIMQERNLSPANLDLALGMVRANNPTSAPVAEPRFEVPGGANSLSGIEAMDQLLSQLKQGNPTLGGTHPQAASNVKSFEEMTGDEVIDQAFAQYLRDNGVRATI